jgi:type II secretory ATPase GspE/PulE/Tfp pilus assembly ATPase PilB-like protein
MSNHPSTALILSGTENAINAFCLYCGKSMRLTSSLQRFCSDSCKNSFAERISELRKKRRNEYQKHFRTSSYKTQVKHVEKVICPKCSNQGYLVRYTVHNVKTGRTVSVYETVRHQITKQGKSVLKGQCYIRSLPKDKEEESPLNARIEAHKSLTS